MNISDLVKLKLDIDKDAFWSDRPESFCSLPYSTEELDRRLKYDPETKYNVSGLITSKGYPVEEHGVRTEDGFILGVQRIPHGLRNGHIGARRRPPVLLQHGLLGASPNWVDNLANQSLGFILADAGYDVWLGNARGSTYSMKHESLREDEKEFWYWSWDEMAKYDLPAMINYILRVTGHKQIYYVGHSQGTVMAFSAFSRDPELGRKVKMFFALGPVTTVEFITSAVRILADTGIYERIVVRWTRRHCGYSCEHMNASRIPVYVSNMPAGTSIWNMDHWGQMVQSGEFIMYDYGCLGNLRHYGQIRPPLYHVEKMQVPTALFWGDRDTLATPKDIRRLIPKIKNLVYNKRITTYGHLDFIWAVDAKEYLYDDMIRLMRAADDD
ncbi:lysosomal acid lipase/cholesteryl ester hydrolase-like [Amphiura filiformis]|uniref:lysosomal acid lipase/cholesteryl ester hydrolase-like n=1 Tax=Amphiura filiformis TaxID=82378 RepID=UPI003B21542E